MSRGSLFDYEIEQLQLIELRTYNNRIKDFLCGDGAQYLYFIDDETSLYFEREYMIDTDPTRKIGIFLTLDDDDNFAALAEILTIEYMSEDEIKYLFYEKMTKDKIGLSSELLPIIKKYLDFETIAYKINRRSAVSRYTMA